MREFSTQNLADCIYLGRFNELQTIADSVVAPLATDLGFLLYRGEVAAGRMKSARLVINMIEDDGDPKNTALKNAYLAFSDLLERFDPTGAQDRIKVSLDEFPNDAELNWIAARVNAAAISTGAGQLTERDGIYHSLPGIADDLQGAVLPRFAYDARIMHAEHINSPEVWQSWIADAIASGDLRAQADGYYGLAQSYRKINSPLPDIHDALDRAGEHYAELGHAIRPIDVACNKAELAIRLDGDLPDVLDPVVKRYLDAGYPKGAISALLTASTVAHERRHIKSAVEYGTQIRELALELEMGLILQANVHRLADAAMQSGEHGLARELCDQALAKPAPHGFKAGVLALKASALNFVGDTSKALVAFHSAIEKFQTAGMESAASDLIAVTAYAIAYDRSVEKIRDADALLASWIDRDKSRQDILAASEKHVERAGLMLLQTTASAPKGPQSQPIAQTVTQAESQLAQAENLLPVDESTQSKALAIRARVAQTRSQIATVNNDLKASRNHTEIARALYEQAHLPFQAANCSYLIGCLDLNLSNAATGAESVELAKKAQTYLLSAYNFYGETSGMIMQVANTAHKLAMLYLNLHPLMNTHAQQQLAQLAETVLSDAQAQIDALRRAYTAPTRTESFAGKQIHSDVSAELLGEALRLFLVVSKDHAKAWGWIAASKARALNDIVATDMHLPVDVQSVIDADPQLQRLIEKERTLVESRVTGPAGERQMWNEKINDTHNELAGYSQLGPYLEQRSGGANGVVDLKAAFDGAPAAAFVDWIRVKNAIWISVARPDMEPKFERINISGQELDRFLQLDFAPKARRSVLRYEPELLDILDPLIHPLGRLTQPGEHLVLCPSGELRSLPLHALSLNGEYLINRNPVSWTPSLSILRHSRARTTSNASAKGIVFGQPVVDSADTHTYAQRLAKARDYDYVAGENVVPSRLADALQNHKVVHFNGHAVFDRDDPMASHLRLANEQRFTVRDAFALRKVAARLVSLGACESSVARQLPGDEPYGMVAALLQAGVPTIIGSLWKVRDKTTGLMMETFYEVLASQSDISPAEALRQAIIALQTNPDYAAPYYWAGMIMSGDPWTHPT